MSTYMHTRTIVTKWSVWCVDVMYCKKFTNSHFLWFVHLTRLQILVCPEISLMTPITLHQRGKSQLSGQPLRYQSHVELPNCALQI